MSIIAIAAIADRSIRNNLLHALKFLTSQLTSSTTNRIFDHLLSGFSDSNPKIREATLKNLVFVVEVLDEKAIEKLLRAVGSLQSDPEAGIRTNAIIFMGKLAPKLTPQVRYVLLLLFFFMIILAIERSSLLLLRHFKIRFIIADSRVLLYYYSIAE